MDSWRLFSQYHYMNRDINPAAQIYLAKLWGKVVGFCGIFHFPHPSVPNMKKIHRLVVLPDYQGIGVGKALLNYVADLYTRKGFRVTITTSHPALNKSLKSPWSLMRQGRSSYISSTGNTKYNRSSTIDRYTCSWEYKP